MSKTHIDPAEERAQYQRQSVQAGPPGRHTIIIQFALGLLAGVEKRALSPGALLEGIGVGPEAQQSPLARIPLDDVAYLLRRLGHVMRDEGLALFERPLKPGSLALLARQMMQCATLGEALEIATALCRILIDDFRMRLLVDGDGARVLLVARQDSSARVASHTVFLYCFVSLCSWLVQDRIRLQDFTVARSRFGRFGKPGTRLLDVVVRFGQDNSSIAFDAACLSMPVLPDRKSADDFIRRSPGSLLLPFRARSNLAEQVRQRLGRHRGQDWPSLDEMARTLRVSPQKLRRTLHDQGSGYQIIKNELRRDMAIEFLLRSDLNLSDIGERLGFTEPSAFQRAFKRWTGVAPGQYRGERRSFDTMTISRPLKNPLRASASAATI